jgi:O-ureido-D-serine cyclo-ligase
MIALVTARHVADGGLDGDMPPLLAAFRGEAEAVSWDDPGVDWSRYAAALVRSTWGYASRLPEFLDWIVRTSRATRLINPPDALRWNADKHYLAGFAAKGLPVVPTRFLEPGEAVDLGFEPPLVVKPAVGAGSVDARRFGPGEAGAARAHAAKLLSARRSVMVQPYLERINRDGETALVHLGGRFSHAIRKGPMLAGPAELVGGLFLKEDIRRREPSAAERDLAARILAAAPPGLAYARVDLAPGPDGEPLLLEFEATEPSLFFEHEPGAARRLAEVVRGYLAGT